MLLADPEVESRAAVPTNLFIVTIVACMTQMLAIAYTVYSFSTFVLTAVVMVGGDLLLLRRYILVMQHVKESTRLETVAKGVK